MPLLTVDNGKRFSRYEGYIPRAVLKRGIFGSAVAMATRKSNSVPSVWRPIAEAAVGEGLVARISPKRIVGRVTYTIPASGKEVETRWWFVLPGDWDINFMPLEEHETFERMRDVASGNYTNTPSYLELKRLESVGKLPHRVKKLGDGTVEGYFRYYRAVADEMEKRRAIPHLGEKDKDRYVGIAIGRDGRILQHQKGHHRAMLAQFLPCDIMEAKVLAVHPQWVRKIAQQSGRSYADAISHAIKEL